MTGPGQHPAVAVRVHQDLPTATSQVESDRLLRQTDDLAAYTTAVLDRWAFAQAQRNRSLPWPHGILDVLAARILPGGRLAGLDTNPAIRCPCGGLAASKTRPSAGSRKPPGLAKISR